uniref:Uncharacterized protein n=1 Tax=Vannella robusta TaxID=1487602 RepID=A0A7S4HMW5_9EUKA|mmetsp:Transcript_13073/g.16383  ORF Transcript_13073/g.16383 Transcript_13073/m.16383 type:complete len:619 (+) Transcript_13073:70-1926(+)
MSDVVKEMQEGSLPSNEEIKEGISDMQNALTENKDCLSKQGQKVLSDATKILDTTKQLIDEKNSGELVQTIYNQVYQAADEDTLEKKRSKLRDILTSSVDGTETLDEAATTATNITNIIRLLVTSREFRALLNDLEKIFEESFVVEEDNPEAQKDNKQDNNQDPISFAFGTVENNSVEPVIFLKPDSTEKAFGEERIPEDAVATEDSNEILEEVEETLIDYWAKLVHTLNTHKEYRDSINYVLNAIGDLSDYIARKSEKLQKLEAKDKDIQEVEKHAAEAWSNAKKFIENWISNGYSIDNLLNTVADLAEKAKQDDELANYFAGLKEFFTKSVADREYVQNEKRVREDAHKHISRGRKLFQGKYQEEFNKVQQEFEKLNEGLQNDEGLNQLEDDFSKLLSDVFLDDKGNVTIHTDLMKDMQIMIPSMVQSLRRLPIPDIELSNEESDLVIRNAVLDCSDIAPNYFRFAVIGNVDKGSVHNHVQIVISKVRATIKDAEFSYKKKTFPEVSVSGNADLKIYGKNGMTIGLEITPFTNNEVSSLKVTKNVCRISKLNLKMRDTEHDILYGFLSPIINAIVKTRVEEVIQNSIKSIVEDGSIGAQDILPASATLSPPTDVLA